MQHAQGIAASGYQPSPLRTGYERIVPQRSGALFAQTAKEEGVVEKVTSEVLVIQYASGKKAHIELGRQFGKSANLVFPHTLLSDLKKGARVKPGDTLAYNPAFFQPDPLNPKQTLWKQGVISKVALMESTDTFEDSSAISEHTAEKLKARLTKVRHLFFNFDQTVRGFVTEGQEVTPETILCTIEEDITTKNDLFDESTLDTLKLLSGNTPRANYEGVVERIEVLYYGDKEDMSESLRALAEASDQRLLKKQKTLGKPPLTGRLEDTLRIDRQIVELDTLVVKLYISESVGYSTGDKAVFANQMKTVTTRIMSGVNETESGQTLDAIFGYTSLNARIILSPELMGTTNTLLRVLSKRVAETYFKAQRSEASKP